MQNASGGINVKKLVCGTLLFLLLAAGCSSNNDNKKLTFSEVKLEDTDEDIQSFVNASTDKNGIYLYQDKGKRLFVFFNGKNQEVENEAVFYKNFDVKSEKQTIKLFIEQAATTSDEQKNLQKQMLYEVKFNKKYDTILLFNNGKNDSFTTVSGR